MEVALKPEIESALSRMASQSGRNEHELATEAIERFVQGEAQFEAWFVGEVEKGIAAADRGELVDHEAVGRMIDQRFAR